MVRNLSQHGLTRPQLQRLAALGAPADQPVDDENCPNSYTPPPSQATPRKQALWKAVQHAKLQGVPLRGIARQLGISRNTVRKYIDLPAPPINRAPTRTRVFRLLDRSTDEGEGVMGFSSATAECGSDVGFLSYSEETDDEIAQSGHYLGS